MQGAFEVGNTGAQQRRDSLAGGLATWPRAQWKTLFAAFFVSLLAHVVVLTLVQVPREGDGRAPAFVVTLTGTVTATRTPAPAAPIAPVPAAQPQPQRLPETAKIPRPRPREGVPADAVAPRVVPAQPPVTQPRSDPTPQEQARALPDAPVQPPSPVSMPELGEVGRKVTGRRLQATVWIDETGRVSKAFVKRNEISDEVAGLLEQALATVRFAPAVQAGRPIADILDTRLCFDTAGVVVASDPECLQPPAGAQPEPAPAR